VKVKKSDPAYVISAIREVFGEDTAAYMAKQLKPVFKAINRNDVAISVNRKIIKLSKKAARKQREALARQRGQPVPMSRKAGHWARAAVSRNSMRRYGYSNGSDLTATYSRYPYWHNPRPGGSHHG
jgi:hypothetical protein